MLIIPTIAFKCLIEMDSSCLSLGRISTPRGVVVDWQGNYVVADYGNHRIQIFNSQGQFVRRFGSEGAGNGQMNSPNGVGLLSNGNIVVCEQGGNRLQILILRAILFVLWVLGRSRIHIISLLILMTSWWLISTTIAFKCSTRMAITSNPLEPGKFHTPLVFAWIMREELLSAKVPRLKEFPSFRFISF